MTQEDTNKTIRRIRGIFRKFSLKFIKRIPAENVRKPDLERLSEFVKKSFLQILLIELLKHLGVIKTTKHQVENTYSSFITNLEKIPNWQIPGLINNSTKSKQLVNFTLNIETISKDITDCINSLSMKDTEEAVYFFVYSFESLIEFGLQKCKTSKNIKLQISDNRKKSGAFYTPKSLIEFTVKSAFNTLSASKKNLNYENLKICDPALGGGLFLIECAKKIIEKSSCKVNKLEFCKRLFENNLFGVDKNPLAVEISKIAFQLVCHPVVIDDNKLRKNIKKGDSLLGISTTFLRNNDPVLKRGRIKFIKTKKTRKTVYTATHLKNWCNLWFKIEDKKKLLDELKLFNKNGKQHSESTRYKESAFIWESEFPEVFNGDNDGFDIIVSNPPYRSFYSRHSGKKSDQSFLFERFAGACLSKIGELESITERINYFLLFIVRSTQLLHKRHGVSSFVLPDTILMNEGYEKLRYALLKYNYLKEATYFADLQFKGATVGTSVITWQKGVEGSDTNLKSVENGIEKQKAYPFKSLINRPFKNLLYIEELKVFSKDNFVKLGDIAYVKDGINPGKRIIREKLITKKSGDMTKRLIEGSSINKFNISWKEKFIIYDDSIISNQQKLEGTSLRKSWIFESPKIVYRQTSPEIIAAVDLEGYYSLNSVQCLILHEHDEDLLYALCAYLNSSFLRKTYQDLTGETRITYPQVHISAVKKLPVPIKLIKDEEIKCLLADLARNLTKNSDINSKNDNLYSDIQEQLYLENDKLINALISND